LSPNDIAKPTSSKAQKVSAKKSKVRAKTTTRKSKVGPKKGSKVAPKYKITNEGKTHKWTGRGRMPLVFKHFIDQGGALNNCLIYASQTIRSLFTQTDPVNKPKRRQHFNTRSYKYPLEGFPALPTLLSLGRAVSLQAMHTSRFLAQGAIHGN